MEDHKQRILDYQGRPIKRREPFWRTLSFKAKAWITSAVAALAVIAGVASNLDKVARFGRLSEEPPVATNSRSAEQQEAIDRGGAAPGTPKSEVKVLDSTDGPGEKEHSGLLPIEVEVSGESSEADAAAVRVDRIKPQSAPVHLEVNSKDASSLSKVSEDKEVAAAVGGVQAQDPPAQKELPSPLADLPEDSEPEPELARLLRFRATRLVAIIDELIESPSDDSRQESPRCAQGPILESLQELRREFLDLHQQHVQAVLGNQEVLTHEIGREIYAYLTDWANQAPWECRYSLRPLVRESKKYKRLDFEPRYIPVH